MSRIVLALLAATLSGGAAAQTLIDQNRAVAGGISPGDMPGFPVILSLPGHYKLSGPLTVPNGVHGIEITARNVTLDLNGHTISSSNACAQNAANKQVSCTLPANASAHGIHSIARSSLVRNGSVRGFAGAGVSLGENSRIEQMQLSENSTYGANLAGGEIVSSMAELNVYGGLVVGPGRILTSRAMNNSGFGLVGRLVADSMAVGNVVGVDGGGVRGSLMTGNTTDVLGAMSLGGNFKGNLPY